MATLKEAKIGSTVTVKKLNGTGAVKRRIMDMGITKGVVTDLDGKFSITVSEKKKVLVFP